jgi:hypothetical protein
MLTFNRPTQKQIAQNRIVSATAVIELRQIIPANEQTA